MLITQRALEARGERIAAELVSSLTMGVGQTRTSPGLVFVPEGDAGGRFTNQVAQQLGAIKPAQLLNQSGAALPK